MVRWMDIKRGLINVRFGELLPESRYSEGAEQVEEVKRRELDIEKRNQTDDSSSSK